MKNLSFIVALLLCLNSVGQTPTWSWAQTAKGSSYEESNAITTDAGGNVYVTGYFGGDSLVVGTTTLYNVLNISTDYFLIKYDAAGNMQWARSAGGTANEIGNAITTDAAGNIYVTGYFYSPTITFGSTVLTNAGNVGDVFIAKYDTQGTLIWAKREGGPGLEIPYAIKADDKGHLFLAGRFSSLSITIGTTTLTQAGSMDAFVVKYDTAGTVLWAKGAGGTSNDEAYGMDVDSNGNVLVCGYFNGNATFGTFLLSTTGNADIFIAKYDATGTVLWAKKAGGNNLEHATSIKTDKEGNSYVCGFYESASLLIGTSTLTNFGVAGNANAFICKYSAAGETLWAHGINGRSKANDIALSGNSVFVGGIFNNDTLNYNSSVLLKAGSSDFFIAKCDTSGNKAWALKQTADGGSSESALGISTDRFGNLLVTGFYNSKPIAFGSSVLITTGTGFDMFVAKLGSVTTGIHALQTQVETVLYPNPTSGMFRIKFNLLQDSYLTHELSIFNSMGEKVYQNHTYSSDEMIYFNQMPKGVYFYTFKSEGRNLETGKLILN